MRRQSSAVLVACGRVKWAPQLQINAVSPVFWAGGTAAAVFVHLEEPVSGYISQRLHSATTCLQAAVICLSNREFWLVHYAPQVYKV